jgi:hypothetical protein
MDEKIWNELSAAAQDALVDSERPEMGVRHELHDYELIVDPEANIMEWTPKGRELAIAAEKMVGQATGLNSLLGHSPEDAEAAARGKASFWDKDDVKE